MATINASFTLNGDIGTYGISAATTMTMNKENSNTGLDKATGLIRKTLASTNEVDLLTVGSGVVVDVPTNKATKVYIKNVNSDSSEYFTIGFGKSSTTGTKQAFAVTDDVNRSVELGRLYAGDFMIIPWCAASDENDIFVKPSVATNMVIEYMVFYE